MRALGWPAVVLGGTLLPMVPGLIPGRTLAWRDSATLHGPLRPVIAQALREGRLPLWNPWEAGGQPLLAQALHAVLHPLSVATAAFSDSIDLFLVALVLSAALGAWVAARTLGVSGAAAAAAAFGYGLSGYALGMTSNALYLAGLATLPWVVAGLRHAGARRNGWLAAAAAVAAAGLAGDPGALAAGGIIGLVLAWDRGGARGLARAVLGAALGLAGAAVQLLPTWAYLASTVRGTGLGAVAPVEKWSLDLARLPELVSPGLVVGLPRSYRAPVFEALASSGGAPFPWAPSVFLGAPLLVLAAAGARRSRSARILAILALFFLWVCLGRQAGAAQALAGVPVWGSLRFWEKMVAPLALCVALAAAEGVEGLREGKAAPLARGARLAAGAALAAGAVALVLPWEAGTAGGLYRMRLAFGLGFAGASLLLLVAAARAAQRAPRGGTVAVAAIVLLQSAAAAPFGLHYGSASALGERPPPLASAAPGPRIVTPLPFNLGEEAGSRDGIDRTHALQYRTGWPATNVAARVENAEVYTGFPSLRWGVVAGAGIHKWPLLRRLGATHVVAPEPGSDVDREALELAAGAGAVGPSRTADGIRTWEVPHRPWASFAPSVRAVSGWREAARAVREEIAAGRDAVIVEAAVAPPTSPGAVLSVERREERLVVEAESAGPALLVVNDAWAPEWTARIDGSPVDILPADVLVRAVRWPAGRHWLVMRYEPPEVALGAALSGSAVAIALAVVLLQRRGRAGA